MKFTDNKLAVVVMLLITSVLIVLQLLSTGVNGETDSITHYQIARYAFKYPVFFLNHWGKPLFTILASSLSQFGYTGAIVFNLLSGLLSGWFAYLVARRLEYRQAWAAIVFTIFTPGYLFVMYSSLTEILFSLVLIASIYLFVSKRYIFSAILISLAPFARLEGVMFIALFIPALIWMKQYKALPFLLSGFMFFSLLGLPVYHDLFWFFTQMPYTTNSSALYGHGSFWYYFIEMEYILNYPLLILSISGLVYIFLNLKNGLKNLKDVKYVTLYFLLIPSFFGFILAQSFLWWQGLGILASHRFIACVLPLGAIFSVTGFEWVMEKAKGSRIVYFMMGAFILTLVIYKPFVYKKIPVKTGINFAVMEQLSSWLKDSPYKSRKAFYTDPMFPFYMDFDPYDQQKCFKIYTYQDINPANLMKSGELLIWDAQFAGYEGHLPFDSLIHNKDLRLLNMFTPIDAFTIIGGEKYKLAVFSKEPRDTSRYIYKQFYFNSFERGLTKNQEPIISTKYSNSGKQSVMLNPENIYSPSVEAKLRSLPGTGKITLKATARILNPSKIGNGEIMLVLSIDDVEHKIYKYIITKDNEVEYKPGEWFKLELTDIVDRSIPANGNYKVYVWYTGKNKIYVDDLKLEYMPVGYE